MQLKPEQLSEIYRNMEHGDIQSIANQLGVKRLAVKYELSTLKDNYDAKIINAAVARIQARGVELNIAVA